jgi:hypothetical protein
MSRLLLLAALVGLVMKPCSILHPQTVIGTGALYALLVLGLGWSHAAALGVCLGAAVVFPIWFFRWARSLLLALDGAVNQQQAAGADPAGGTQALAGLARERQDPQGVPLQDDLSGAGAGRKARDQ